MKKILLLCLLMVNMLISAQITLGQGSTVVGKVPVDSYWEYSYSQQIFTKQEINANAAGNITGLKFYLDPAGIITNSSDWVVYLGHTSKTEFTSDTDWVPVSDLTEVYAGTVSNVNGMVELTFATPFPYNNTQNLVIAVDENNPAYDDERVFYVHHLNNVPKNSIGIIGFSDIDPSDPGYGSLFDYRSVVSFMGLTANTLPACTSVMSPANNAVMVPLTSDISWYPSPGATSYKISIGTTPGGSNIVNQQTVTTTSFTPSSPLSLDTTYYVKVTAVGAGGESSGCAETKFTTTLSSPLNDECATAVTLTVNPDMNCASKTFGHTFGATDSSLPVDPCYGEADDDVWYKFTATSASHIVSLSNMVSIGSEDSYSLQFQVLSGDCSTLANVVCSDYDELKVVSGLTVGATYYIRVYTDGGAGEAQSFDICIGTLPPTPVNDDCSGALTASTFPYTYTQSDAAGATNNSGFVEICSNSMNDGTWFKFTGDGTMHHIKVSMPAGSGFDPQIGVFSGACDSLACESTIDSNSAGNAEEISVPTVAGTTYYVNVGHYSGYTDYLEGAFTITINKGTLATSEVSKAKNEIRVYPNPFADILNIAKADQVKSVSVMDISGRLVKTIENPSSTLHLNELKQGLYVVILNMKDGSKQTVKAIKK
ncbi:T9SS type A sorting domain-containing protein [Chryseobacterium bernardetii]|uniref:T9SS type A sorting domain-containing protein n=1 Tax=Chryseobacterium bernardetii TaxID=1241978 RepID=UPI000F4F2A90|nr:T9SS type A sorting domain-containing protein [Chryseobacterium bernardetii]AZB35948.1 T9SS C-terminal target domain-containing protein [Chryseobacterium bernardetii]